MVYRLRSVLPVLTAYPMALGSSGLGNKNPSGLKSRVSYKPFCRHHFEITVAVGDIVEDAFFTPKSYIRSRVLGIGISDKIGDVVETALLPSSRSYQEQRRVYFNSARSVVSPRYDVVHGAFCWRICRNNGAGVNIADGQGFIKEVIPMLFSPRRENWLVKFSASESRYFDRSTFTTRRHKCRSYRYAALSPWSRPK